MSNIMVDISDKSINNLLSEFEYNMHIAKECIVDLTLLEVSTVTPILIEREYPIPEQVQLIDTRSERQIILPDPIELDSEIMFEHIQLIDTRSERQIIPMIDPSHMTFQQALDFIANLTNIYVPNPILSQEELAPLKRDWPIRVRPTIAGILIDIEEHNKPYLVFDESFIDTSYVSEYSDLVDIVAHDVNEFMDIEAQRKAIEEFNRLKSDYDFAVRLQNEYILNRDSFIDPRMSYVPIFRDQSKLLIA